MKLNLKMPVMIPPCEYSGKRFRVAQNRAKSSGGTIYENDSNRGVFLVLTDEQRDRMYPLGLPEGTSHY